MAKDEKERVSYIRKMASTITPSEEEKRDLYTLANNVPFDDRINHEADLTDLNLTLIKSYLKEINSSLYPVSYTHLSVFFGSVLPVRKQKKSA